MPFALGARSLARLEGVHPDLVKVVQLAIRKSDLDPVINGDVSWDWPLYHRLAKHVKAAAAELGVPITWGGDWVRFRDGPHWELSWKAYPK